MELIIIIFLGVGISGEMSCGHFAQHFWNTKCLKAPGFSQLSKKIDVLDVKFWFNNIFIGQQHVGFNYRIVHRVPI